MRTSQLYFRQFNDNKIGFVGIITSETKLAMTTETLHHGALVKDRDGPMKFYLFPSTEDSVTPTDGCRALDTTEYDINNLLLNTQWATLKAPMLGASCGQCFLREAQQYQEEPRHRYIVTGVWEDAGSVMRDTPFLFLQGVSEGLAFPVKPRRYATDPGIGHSLGQVLTLPLWEDNGLTYALYSSLHLEVLKEVLGLSHHLATGGTEADYMPHNAERWLANQRNVKCICRHQTKDESYRQYAAKMAEAGFNFNDNFYLQTPQDKQAYLAAMDSIIKATQAA